MKYKFPVPVERPEDTDYKSDSISDQIIHFGKHVKFLQQKQCYEIQHIRHDRIAHAYDPEFYKLQKTFHLLLIQINMKQMEESLDDPNYSMPDFLYIFVHSTTLSRCRSQQSYEAYRKYPLKGWNPILLRSPQLFYICQILVHVFQTAAMFYLATLIIYIAYRTVNDQPGTLVNYNNVQSRPVNRIISVIYHYRGL